MVEVPDVGTIAEQIKARIGQIEEQLKAHRDLSDELDRLRGALSRLEGTVATRPKGRRASAKVAARATTKSASKRADAAKTSTAGRKPARTAAVAPKGHVRAKVLEALKDGSKTAGEVANMTGIARATASTTLSKLAKSGDVLKAERGYELPR